MHLAFTYTVEKDVENFIKGTKSVNNPKPTRLQRLYIEKHGEEITEAKVKAFIENYLQENNIDTKTEETRLTGNWTAIENTFIERVEKIFGLHYPAATITAYLTTNSRCTYNIAENYFFVDFGIQPLKASSGRMTQPRVAEQWSYDYKNPNATVMHELLHFYTFHAFHSKLEQQGILKQAYNDIKESLTELLNVEFADLMKGARRAGC